MSEKSGEAYISEKRGRYGIDQSLLYPLSENKLRKGQYSTIYKGEDTLFRREIAIKFYNFSNVIKQIGTNEDVNVNEETCRNQIPEEISRCAKVNHPNNVVIYDSIDDKQGLYIVMELITGDTLFERLERKIYKDKDKLEIIIRDLRNIAAVLDAAHENKIVHCGVSPENIMFQKIKVDGENAEEVIKLIDWGNSFSMDLEDSMYLKYLPQSDRYVKKSKYRAPEVTKTQTINEQADVYSLAAIVCELLFGNPNIEEVKEEERKIFGDDLCRIISQGLSEKYTNRPTSCIKFLEEVQEAWDDHKKKETEKEKQKPNGKSLKVILISLVVLVIFQTLFFVLPNNNSSKVVTSNNNPPTPRPSDIQVGNLFLRYVVEFNQDDSEAKKEEMVRVRFTSERGGYLYIINSKTKEILLSNSPKKETVESTNQMKAKQDFRFPFPGYFPRYVNKGNMEFHWTIIFSDKLLINFEFLNKQPGKDVIVGKEEWAQFSQDIYQKQRIDKRTTDYQGVLWGETDIAIFDIQF